MRLRYVNRKGSRHSFSHLVVWFLLWVLGKELLNKGGLLFLGLSGALCDLVDFLVEADGAAQVLEVVRLFLEGLTALTLLPPQLRLSLFRDSQLLSFFALCLLPLHCA